MGHVCHATRESIFSVLRSVHVGSRPTSTDNFLGVRCHDSDMLYALSFSFKPVDTAPVAVIAFLEK